MKRKGNTTIAISVLALILAILAVIRCEPMTADWLGILVGILALLVTVLLGWNIYSAIQLDKIIDNRLTEVTKKADRKIKIALATTQSRVVKGYLANKDWYMAMEGYSFFISDILELKDKGMASDIIPLINNLLNEMSINDDKEIKALKRLIVNIKKLSALDERACDLYRKALDIRASS